MITIRAVIETLAKIHVKSLFSGIPFPGSLRLKDGIILNKQITQISGLYV